MLCILLPDCIPHNDNVFKRQLKATNLFWTLSRAFPIFTALCRTLLRQRCHHTIAHSFNDSVGLRQRDVGCVGTWWHPALVVITIQLITSWECLSIITTGTGPKAKNKRTCTFSIFGQLHSVIHVVTFKICRGVK